MQACPPNPFSVHQILCFRTIAQVDKKIPTWAPQLRVRKVNLSLFCFLPCNKIVQVEWISPAGRVDFGRRLTLCPRKLLPLKDTVTLLYPMGKAYPNSAPITGLSDPVGGGANSGDDHDAPNSHWQAAFSKIFPMPRFCVDEALVVPTWGVMVPERTLSYAPQSGSQTQTCSLRPHKWSQSWNARLHWSVFQEPVL